MAFDKIHRTTLFFYGLKYVLTYRFLKEKSPLICGLVMHNKCNLNCLHCRITERPDDKLSFEGESFILKVASRFFGVIGNINLTMLSNTHTIKVSWQQLFIQMGHIQ
jgi:hypothetical protein